MDAEPDYRVDVGVCGFRCSSTKRDRFDADGDAADMGCQMNAGENSAATGAECSAYDVPAGFVPPANDVSGKLDKFPVRR